MTTIRIDTLANRIAATKDLLAMLLEELEDLHLLAYERATAASEAKVSGGSPDYALDTHGNPHARDAYRLLGNLTYRICDELENASNQALNVLRKGNTPGRSGPRHLRLIELGEQIVNQAQRARRGDYTPIRRGNQPDTIAALEEAIRDRDAAQRQVTALERERDRMRHDANNRRRPRGEAEQRWGSSTS